MSKYLVQMLNNKSALKFKTHVDIEEFIMQGIHILAIKLTGFFDMLFINDKALFHDADFECPGIGVIEFIPIFNEATVNKIIKCTFWRNKAND